MSIPLFRAAAAVLVAGLALVLAAGVSAQQPISYQGSLHQSGAPFSGQADLTFRLFDSAAEGSQIGAEIFLPDWPVEAGLFQVELEFGSGSFGPDPRWLEIAVNGVALTPRQPIHAAPVALYALDGVGGEDNRWVINGNAIAYLDGPVGIGTDTPSAALEVRSNSSIGVPQAYLVELEDDFARLTFGNTDSPRFWTLAALTRGDNLLDDRFHLFHSANGDVLRIDGAGHVALGAWLPSTAYRLAVSEGMLVSRDATSGLVPHLSLLETGSTHPVRQAFWNSSLGRGWRLDGSFDPDNPAADRFSLVSAGIDGTGERFSVLGSGLTGIGFSDPPASLAVRARSAWSWSTGNGRGDFHVGDGDVGLSMGVSLGGGGRGVSRIWTKGGVEHLFFGSADHGLTLAMLPGQLGVNTASPSAALDVDGNVRVRSLNHAELLPQSVVVDATGNLSVSPLRQISIPAAAFRSTDSLVGTFLDLDHVFVTTPGSLHSLLAPVVLPTGARIVSVTAWITDSQNDGDLRISLTAAGFMPETGSQIVSLLDSSGASPTVQPLIDASVFHVVDAETYQYYVRVWPINGAWDGTRSLAIHALTIDYRL